MIIIDFISSHAPLEKVQYIPAFSDMSTVLNRRAAYALTFSRFILRTWRANILQLDKVVLNHKSRTLLLSDKL